MTHILNPTTTNRQIQIIKGTILGGSSLIKPKNGKNCYLSMRSKQAKWIEYKALQLANMATPTPFTVENTFRWHSMCYPVFNTIYDLFYDNDKKRRLSVSSLELLSDMAFSIWFGDCGKINDGRVELNTNIWGKEGTEAIVNYFEIIDYESTIISTNDKYRVILNKSSSDEFMKLVVPCLPSWFFEG